MRFTDILPHNGISGQHDDICSFFSLLNLGKACLLFSIKEHDIEFWWPFHVRTQRKVDDSIQRTVNIMYIMKC